MQSNICSYISSLGLAQTEANYFDIQIQHSRGRLAHSGGVLDDLRVISVVRDYIFHQTWHRWRGRRRSERCHGSLPGFGEESKRTEDNISILGVCFKGEHNLKAVPDNFVLCLLILRSFLKNSTTISGRKKKWVTTRNLCIVLLSLAVTEWKNHAMLLRRCL